MDNIVEAYIKKKKSFIVLILGLPCSNKTELAKELFGDLSNGVKNLSLININDFYNNEFVEKEIDGIKYNLYDHPDNLNWEALNTEVNNKKEYGVVLYGNYIDPDKINFDLDFVYFIDLNNNLCKEQLIKNNLIKTNISVEESQEEKDKKIDTYFEKVMLPSFDKLREIIKEKMSVNKFFNLKEDTKFDDVYDKLFDILMNNIEKSLKELKEKEQGTKEKNHKFNSKGIKNKKQKK